MRQLRLMLMRVETKGCAFVVVCTIALVLLVCGGTVGQAARKAHPDMHRTDWRDGSVRHLQQPLASSSARRLLDVGALTTTQFVIVIICSVLGFLLLIAVILMVVLVCRRQSTVAPVADQQMLHMAANTVAATAASQMPALKAPVNNADHLTYPHPLLMQRQIQAELIAQQQRALRGRGPNIDALALAKQLMYTGQLEAAHSVAYNAGIAHLLPGLQHQMSAAALQASDMPFPTQTQFAPMQFQPQYGSYNAVYASSAGAYPGVQQQQQHLASQQQYGAPVQVAQTSTSAYVGQQPMAGRPLSMQQQLQQHAMQQQHTGSTPIPSVQPLQQPQALGPGPPGVAIPWEHREQQSVVEADSQAQATTHAGASAPVVIPATAQTGSSAS